MNIFSKYALYGLLINTFILTTQACACATDFNKVFAVNLKLKESTRINPTRVSDVKKRRSEQDFFPDRTQLDEISSSLGIDVNFSEKQDSQEQYSQEQYCIGAPIGSAALRGSACKTTVISDEIKELILKWEAEDALELSRLGGPAPSIDETDYTFLLNRFNLIR